MPTISVDEYNTEEAMWRSRRNITPRGYSTREWISYCDSQADTIARRAARRALEIAEPFLAPIATKPLPRAAPMAAKPLLVRQNAVCIPARVVKSAKHAKRRHQQRTAKMVSDQDRLIEEAIEMEWMIGKMAETYDQLRAERAALGAKEQFGETRRHEWRRLSRQIKECKGVMERSELQLAALEDTICGPTN